jgi:hypothetical protein
MKYLQAIALIAVILISTSFTCSRSGSARLRPSLHFWDFVEPLPKIHVFPLPRKRRLISVGDTLYMLNQQNRILWQWTSDGPPFTDDPILDSGGTIYVIGYDLTWAAIDSSTGHEKFRSTANGRGLFSQIELYRRDSYLVLTDMSGYRDSLRDNTIEDFVYLCRGNDVLWGANIPAKGRLRISGDKVFLVFLRHNRIVRWSLRIPHHPREAVGLVDGRLWSKQNG